MPNFDDKLSSSQIRAVVAYVLSISRATAQEIQPSADTSPQNPPGALGDLPESLIGNPMRGEELFFASSQGKANEKGCAGCHSIDGRGNSVGPDLTGLARKKPGDLLRDIVFPSAQVDSAYRTFRITMKNGETIMGLKREETTTALRVHDTSSNPPVLRRLPKDQIQTVEPQSHSVMPSGYGAEYTLRQLLDLVSFLKSSGAASPVKVNFLDLQ
jgi:putative heme-binding domain-containing protein